MEIVRKTIGLHDIGEDARRQYMDARSAFTEWERTAKSAAEVRGGMYWKTQGNRKTQGNSKNPAKTDYLIRTSVSNAQTSLGPRSPQTEDIYSKFIGRKATLETRLKSLTAQLGVHKRLNRALFVGRAPQLLVDILTMLERAGIAAHFMVVGTHALYAYEAAAGVRVESGDVLATRDIDLLWDTRKRIQFAALIKSSGASMLGLLKKIDPTFEILDGQRHTAINSKGVEVDIIRREALKGDPHPLRMTGDEDDFWAVQAQRAGKLLSAQRFSAMIVSASGDMARMTTVSPAVFAGFKRWLSTQPACDPMKKSRDALQADVLEQMAAEYLPQPAQ